MATITRCASTSSSASQSSSASCSCSPQPEPEEDDNEWWEVDDDVDALSMLGDLDPETATEDEIAMAQEYLLWLLEETEDPAIRNAALLQLADYAAEVLGDFSSLYATPLFPFGPWIRTIDGDPLAVPLYNRHYSAKKKRSSPLFIGPGTKLVLVTYEYDALFAWRISRHRKDRQWGAECTIFRNESKHLSSTMILWAEHAARAEWPYLTRMYTYVQPSKIRSNNPGYCFMQAGWTRTRHVSKRKKLVLLEKIVIPDILHDQWLRRPQ